MFGLPLKSADKIIACCLGENSYSIVALQDNKKLLFNIFREFDEKPEQMVRSFIEDVDRLKLVGSGCRVVLAPGQYQLLLMDALDVPEDDMAKALRWRLKGLVEYPLNDIALDVFVVPAHGVVGQRKKVFVAVTLLSALKKKLDMLEAAFLEVESVGIGEIALRNLLALVPGLQGEPVIAISLEKGLCQLQILHNNALYLVRELALNQKLIDENDPQAQNILLEIQRSIDYCLSELKLPEPKHIVFTPSFYQATSLLQLLRDELSKDIILLNLADYLEMEPPLTLKEQQDCFYGIGGALTYTADEPLEPDEQA